MEIEAKFVVPTAQVARTLRAVDRVTGYSLSAPTRLTVRDTFFDSPDSHLLNVRYVLRTRRRSDGKTFLTLKTSTIRRGAIHSRPEIEVEIPERSARRSLRADDLPTAIRKAVEPLIGAEPLAPIFSISQTREVRIVRYGRKIVAEWSLDRVRFHAASRRRAFYELEIELKKGGSEDDLHSIVRWVEREFQLAPQEESKFARALKFVRATE
jgi:inorganic triphosphatase YgiF